MRLAHYQHCFYNEAGWNDGGVAGGRMRQAQQLPTTREPLPRLNMGASLCRNAVVNHTKTKLPLSE